jgi:voltage-gated potassium channel
MRLDYQEYDRRAEIPLLTLSGAFLLVLAIPIINTDLAPWQRNSLRVADLLIWLTFALDYGTRLVLAERRWHFVKTHPVELLAVALPALRPLRLLRLFSIGNMLAARSRRSLVTQATRLVVTGAGVLVFVASVGVLDAERDAPGRNIATFGDALWWASSTITTVGYGDRFPVTTEGRCIAAALMGLGIALVGVLTASIAAWFVREVAKTEHEVVDPLEERIKALEAKIDLLLARA